MTRRFGSILLAFLIATQTVGVAGADETEQTPDATQTSADDDSREAFLNGAKWRRLRRNFDGWLSVQKVYSPEEVDAIKQELDARIKSMSLPELKDFADDTEDRLKILMSDDAMDARAYLNHFTMKGRRRALSPDGKVENIFDMTVPQLRQELRDFQERRAGRAKAQSQFIKTQNELATASIEAQRAQQRADVEAARNRSAAQFGNQSNAHSPYTPRRRERPTQYRRSPSTYITPWGGVGFIFH